MKKKIFLGTEFFDVMMGLDGDAGYYVDKTELLYELVDKTGNIVSLFTRPRRFGKSLTISMMEYFFDIRRKGSRAFEGLNIQKNHPEFCEKWMNQFPTIRITLKDVESISYDTALEKMKIEIADTFRPFRKEIMESGEVDPEDRKMFDQVMDRSISDAQLQGTLKALTRMLYNVYGKKVVLLIDEYDVPLAKAHQNGYYRKMLELIRGLLSISLKSNQYLKLAVVTGCLRIPKESIFTSVNNFTAYSVLDEEFSEFFGFTEEEVTELLKYYDREDALPLVKKWYDGYLFGNTEIYCPWDVISYVSTLRNYPDARPKAYWENTSGNGAIRAFFELDDEDDGVTEQLETLLNGGTIMESVTNTLTYEEAYTSVSNIWSILLMTGYVTVVKREGTGRREEGYQGVELRIPNREVSLIFQDVLMDQFRRTVDQGQIRELMDALWNGEEESASEILSDLLFDTISYMDYHENYYHGFLEGVFTGRGYKPKSNLEQGLGRPDVLLKDRKNRRVLVIECKKAESEERMEYWCDEAIKQIVDKQYAGNTNGFRSVLCYGVSFFEKSAMVKLLRS